MQTWSLSRTLVLFLTLILTPWSVFAADSPPTTAAARLDLDKQCTTCHDQTWKYPVLRIYQTPHGVRGDPRAPNCITCHGASEKHIADATARPDVVFGDKNSIPPDVVFGDRSTVKGIKARQMIFDPSDAAKQNKTCISCHEGGLRTHWSGSQHQVAGLACTSCHSIHQAKDPILVRATQREVCFNCHKEQRADSHKLSNHPIQEGKVVCSDCHNPHGSTGPKLLKKNTVNETCWQCHADKRGPFLWEHQPVTEDCTNCHTPHGSNIAPLLKDRAPFLCDDCHNGPHQSNNAIGPGAVPIIQGNATGRACMNCHVMVHGSNSPDGAYLHR
jgi:DmsE family decaheme c-type cytochrome